MLLPSLSQRWTLSESCSTRSSSCSVSLATCSSSSSWWWTSACGPSPTPSCCHWRSATSWWPFSACLLPSSPTSWRTSSSEPQCARSSRTLWVRTQQIALHDPDAFRSFVSMKVANYCAFSRLFGVFSWVSKWPLLINSCTFDLWTIKREAGKIIQQVDRFAGSDLCTEITENRDIGIKCLSCKMRNGVTESEELIN